MLHAASRDCTRLQLLLNAEWRKRQSVERTISDFWIRVSNNSTLVDMVMEDFILLFILAMIGACSLSWHRFPGAFLTVVCYTTVLLTGSPGRMSQLYSRVCTLFWPVSIGAWKTFLSMMRLLICNIVVSSLDTIFQINHISWLLTLLLPFCASLILLLSSLSSILRLSL